ncbi:hypothetical protein [Candidatus Williamhamiltonella defendens]|uniref:hypothetical protein n=1 Tax=Candidatus Williamhamiltonella defendens TaxID=138072 RepID=UPI0015833EB6|nr:hypothetical protein [Candidatus Hamiltonella defensa]
MITKPNMLMEITKSKQVVIKKDNSKIECFNTSLEEKNFLLLIRAEKAAQKTTDAKTKVMALVNSEKNRGMDKMQEGGVSTLAFIWAVIDNRKAREFKESFILPYLLQEMTQVLSTTLSADHLALKYGLSQRQVLNVIRWAQTSSDLTQAHPPILNKTDKARHNLMSVKSG